MRDYISRESALKAIYTSTAPALEVKAIPAADVVEVRHGRWIKFSRGDVCSECQYQTGRYEHGGNYCPTCGAKMDGGHDDV